MNEELKKIKKKFGEEMMQTCRSLFPNILSHEGLLLEVLENHFIPSKELIKDIKSQNKLKEFRDYVITLSNLTYEYDDTISIDPVILMKKAGYILKEVKTQEELMSYIKYYRPSEQLCSFHERGSRLDHCHIFFAVKENANEIIRERFTNPDKHDEYGTSVISIQFSRDESNCLSIKNRYNHTVPNPDNTFDNNLDNIIPGLTNSFKNYYGLFPKAKQQPRLDIENYIEVENKVLKFNYAHDFMFFCPNNIIIKNNKIEKYDMEKYIIMDYFILDLVNKKIKVLSEEGRIDGFIKDLKNIENIKIKNNKETKEVIILTKENHNIKITLDKENKIIEYENNSLEILENFLRSNHSLKKINTPNVKEIKSYALYKKPNLELININSNIKKIGREAFSDSKFKELIIPEGVEIIEDEAFKNCEIETLILPSTIKRLGRGAFEQNKIKELILPESLEVIGDYAFYNNNIEHLIIPSTLKQIGTSAFQRNNFNTLEIPSTTIIGPFAFDLNVVKTIIKIESKKENIFKKLLRR